MFTSLLCLFGTEYEVPIFIRVALCLLRDFYYLPSNLFFTVRTINCSLMQGCIPVQHMNPLAVISLTCNLPGFCVLLGFVCANFCLLWFYLFISLFIFSSYANLTNECCSTVLVSGLSLEQVQRMVVWTLRIKTLSVLRTTKYSDISRAAKPRLKIDKIAHEKYMIENKKKRGKNYCLLSFSHSK